MLVDTEDRVGNAEAALDELLSDRRLGEHAALQALVESLISCLDDQDWEHAYAVVRGIEILMSALHDDLRFGPRLGSAVADMEILTG